MKLSGFGLSNPNLEEMNSNAVVVKNLSKRFRIPHERKLTVYENIVGLIKGGSYTYGEFQVLNDVSFTIKRVETFGVIGPNNDVVGTKKVLAEYSRMRQ